MNLPPDYLERTYAGVLGKIIGVYLGRPVEGWTHERILRDIGEIWFYVNDRHGKALAADGRNHPLVVTDDDVSGTFTFVRALEDHGADVTAEQVGQTWLNYIIEKRTILWWGGMGNSTEHTAFLRLKRGVPAPCSGSTALNGRVVSEQIGAQIFIDGWAMTCPGDPERAAALARAAASVSHDGEAIYGAQVVAAMEAQAYVERDLGSLLDTAVRLIPADSAIYRMTAGLQDLRQTEQDWRAAFAWLALHYGYDEYGGNCHVVPNHGVVQLALLWGDGDFQKSLMIANTCGWDTDCNSGNVGCLMGIRNGLAGIDAGPDWRGPVADRLYLPTADGGRTITDAVRETYSLANIARRASRLPPLVPKGGARFHFELPGSVQGFAAEPTGYFDAAVTVENVAGHSEEGSRSLALRYRRVARGRPARVRTATFIPPDALDGAGYGLVATPTLYSGQVLEASVLADAANDLPVVVRPVVYHYDEADAVAMVAGEAAELPAGERRRFRWRVPDTRGFPIVYVGLELLSDAAASGTVYLDSLGWDGPPRLRLDRGDRQPTKAWRKAWVDAVDGSSYWGPESLRLVQDCGRGLMMHGTRQWRDYQVSADVMPHMTPAAGLAVRVQGLRRYYALLLVPGRAQVVKVRDDRQRVLAELPLDWQATGGARLTLRADGARLCASVGGRALPEAVDHEQPFADGGIALVCEEGRCGFGPVEVGPSGDE